MGRTKADHKYGGGLKVVIKKLHAIPIKKKERESISLNHTQINRKNLHYKKH